jgi:hypothetical protein
LDSPEHDSSQKKSNLGDFLGGGQHLEIQSLEEKKERSWPEIGGGAIALASLKREQEVTNERMDDDRLTFLKK